MLRQDRVEDATETVLECTGLFLSLRLAREGLATVLLLQESGKRRRLTLAVLNASIADLRKLEREPRVSFQLAAAG